MTTRTVFRLNNANLYHSNHKWQDHEAHLVLRQYQHKMKWSNRHKILDIGCGPGDFTFSYLLPLIPKDGEVWGGDVSQAMIQYANSNFQDPRLRFEVMDIADSDIGEKYRDTFNTVFSSFCLHWVQDQWSAMKNIYDILQDGGEALLLFLASNPIYTLYEIMARTKKWAPYMHDFRSAISPYHYSPDPESDVRNLLNDVGFLVKDCCCKTATCKIPTNEFFQTIRAVDPFYDRMPENLIDEYYKDCQTIIWNENLARLSKETDEIVVSYTLITVYAEKPILNLNL